ncbi:MAG: UDP-N-acetylglucosamine--N-acetylmuramyl-(pentapeptide) pyrophosphoryl-undecaprenol N-acetylglucosamine transferase [Patescibacteria group bacterium]
MKIIITGGHLTPALACIDFIQKNHPGDEIIFIGRKFSQENKQLSQEKTEIKKRTLKFLALSTPKFLSHKTLNLLIQMPQFIRAILKSKQIIKVNRPDILLSFGGYLSLPVAIAAKLTKTPIIIHEQTSSLGLANRIISHFANTVALSQEIKKYKNHKNFSIAGNPLRSSLIKKANKPNWLEHDERKPLLYITGGNQGSQIINKLILESLEDLLKDFNIIHQTGSSKNNFKNNKNYYSKAWIKEKELAWILQNTDLAISRSGANTVQELQYFAIPTLFIPLPTARNNEQLDNAKKLEKFGGALILEQKRINSTKLLRYLEKLNDNKKLIQKNLQENKPEQSLDAAQNIYQLLKEHAVKK